MEIYKEMEYILFNGEKKLSNNYTLQKSCVCNDKLIFEANNGFEKALLDGFFLVKIPGSLDVSSADVFAMNFYKPKNSADEIDEYYKGYSDIGPEIFGDPLLGFHKRKYQIEQFLLERRFWKQYYPSELTSLGDSLCRLSTVIIKNVIKKVKIPKAYWNKATGGCS